jgi:glycosyltransferase involved in cell wall biosynthesis
MRIAQVAPLIERVPPRLYGGTERVVHYLTEELVRRGHDVTLFASGDSCTSATLVAGCEQALRLDPGCRDPLTHHVLMLEKLRQRARHFDIIHFHIDFLHFPLCRALTVPHLTTLHGRQDLPDLVHVYREFHDEPLVSISHSQRRPLPGAAWTATVHHGLPLDLHRFSATPAGYLAFLGRISPEKRLDRAIELARSTGHELRIAAKVDRADRAHFERDIRPLLALPGVEYVGEIAENDKSAFLGGASALLFPIDWPEPFGLVMIEAMACGTPVIAWRHGSVPEIIEDGVTGFVVDSMKEALAAIERIPDLNRRLIRRRFEQRFSAARMARDYIGVYERLIGRKRLARVPALARQAEGAGAKG